MQLVEIKQVADYGRAENGLRRVGGVGVKQGTGIREQGTAGCEGLTRGAGEQGLGTRD